MRRTSQSIVANPVLVGAVTTLVVLVAVFLAYNANNGLPFVPTRALRIDMPSGAELVKGNEVRIGGFRVGVVERMLPTHLAGGGTGARLSIKLDQRAGKIPVDSRAQIRPRSALGLKYVEITLGRSKRHIADGGLLDQTNTKVPIELDDVYSTFDEPTRRASSANLDGFGDTFAFRGSALNDLIGTLPRLFGVLTPVAANLNDPRTHFSRFFSELGDAARIVAPISKTQARLFTTMANTFDAIDRDPAALKATISKGPNTLAVGTRALRDQRPFLRDTVLFSRDLQAAAKDLRPSLPIINSALQTGAPIVRRSTQLNTRLQTTLGDLRDLTSAPTTNAAIDALTATVTTLQPQLRFLGPYITVCNSWNFFWTLTAEHFTAPTSTGTAERTLLNSAGNQDNSIGSMGATLPAAGKGVTRGTPQYLHDAFYGHAVDSQGAADCEAGQQGYVRRGNPYAQGKFATDPDYQQVVTDLPHDPTGSVTFPGDKSPTRGTLSGPTYKRLNRDGTGEGRNPSRVPDGQTFTAEPGGKGARIVTP